MISKETVGKIKASTCAVGYSTVPGNILQENPYSPFFKVVGSAFLVRPTTAITNRHVIEGLLQAQASLGFPDAQRYLSFQFPERTGMGLLRLYIRAASVFREVNQEEPFRLDVGFLEFDRPKDEPAFEQCRPVVLAEDPIVHVTEEIAVCGYPYGTNLLHIDHRIYRHGPVIQSGHISAVAPYETWDAPTELLLDVRTAAGMSGSPVFRPNGTVIGLHWGGWEATTAMAVPLTREYVEHWLHQFDKGLGPQP